MFFEKGGEYVPVTNVCEQLPVGVYKATYNYNYSSFVLTYLKPRFAVPEVVYGGSERFVDKAVRSALACSKVTGILLHGAPGTGKSLTGEIIANRLNMPVIVLVDSDYIKELPSLLSQANQELIVFVDEYDKVFNNQQDLLTILDGVGTPANRLVFIATCNELALAEQMYNRPSRFKYVKQFGKLAHEDIAGIVNSRMKNFTKATRTEVIKLLNKKKNPNYDTVSCFCDEVLAHVGHLTVDQVAEDFNFEV